MSSYDRQFGEPWGLPPHDVLRRARLSTCAPQSVDLCLPLLTDEEADRIRQIVAKEGFVFGVKFYRELTYAGLKTAKQIVAKICPEHAPPEYR